MLRNEKLIKISVIKEQKNKKNKILCVNMKSHKISHSGFISPLTLKNLTPKNPILKNWNKDRLVRFLPKLRNIFKEQQKFETSQNLATFLIKDIACTFYLLNDHIILQN